MIAAAWDHFWFEKRPATALGVFRIAFACLLLFNALALGLDFGSWFGTSSFASLATHMSSYDGLRLNVLMLLPDRNWAAWLVFGLYCAGTVSLLIGYRTRLAAFVIYFTLLSLHHANPLILNSGDLLMQIVPLYLCLVDSGAALGVCSQGTLDRPAMIDPLGWRLIQVQTTVVYFATWIHKMNGPYWPGGMATYYTSRVEAYWKFHLPYVFEHLWTVHLATWSTLAIEFALGTLIWVPQLRLPVILAGFALHLGIELTMHIHLFEWTMMVLLLSFLKQEDFLRVRAFVRGVRGPSKTLPAVQG